MDTLKVDKNNSAPVVEKRADKYVVVENARTYLNGTLTEYKAGAVLDDFAQVSALLASGCTFLKPLAPDTLVVKCPHCRGNVVVENAANTRSKGKR